MQMGAEQLGSIGFERGAGTSLCLNASIFLEEL